MITSKNLYIEILSGEDEETRRLLENSSISISWGRLLIDCRSDARLQAVRDRIDGICRRVVSLEIPVNKIFLLQNEVVRSEIDPHLVLQWVKSGMSQAPLIRLLPTEFEASIAIIRMADHKGLFATDRLAQDDRVNPNDWTGDDIGSRFNIPEFFDKYLNDLIRHQMLNQYPLVCLDGEGNQQEQIINAWLTSWRGDLVRVVEVLNKRYL